MGSLSMAWILVGLPPAVIATVVVVYPLLLRLAVAVRRPAEDSATGDAPRSVSVVITCHNEAVELPGALDAVLAQDWSRHPQIIVASDASTDRTDAIARAYEDRGVTVYRAENRSGKTTVENEVSEIVTGDVIVFLDAAARPRRDSITCVVDAFADPTVGVASGREVLDSTGAEAVYISFEEQIRALETQLGGIVGANGTLFAIRRELFVELEPFAPRDFASVLLAHHLGLRAVSVPADCLIRPATDPSTERCRRSRTMSQGVLTLLRYRHWLHPALRRGFIIKLLGHKVGRWLLIPSVLVAAVAAAVLLVAMGLGGAVLVGVVAAPLAAVALEWRLGRSNDARWLPFVLAWLLGGVHSLKLIVQGRPPATWEPTRRV